MAKYVQYTPEVFAKQDGGVHAWWFPISFSQSQLGDRNVGSNACTLIAVLLAGRLDEFKIPIWGFADQPLSRMLVTSIAEGIVEGNEMHESLMLRGELYDMDLTVPEALHACRFKYPRLTEWLEKTTLVMDPIGETLAENIHAGITDFEMSPPPLMKENSDLYIVLLVGGRSCLFCYQPRTSKVTLIDGHSHVLLKAGAVVGQARISDLDQLCRWFSSICTSSFSNWVKNNAPPPYELAYLYQRA